MALKCFLGTLSPVGDILSSPPKAYVNVQNSIVFENGVLQPGTNGTALLNPADGSVEFVSTDSLAQIKAKVAAFAVARFNELTGRTDGSTIQFVWLDDRGLL